MGDTGLAVNYYEEGVEFLSKLSAKDLEVGIWFLTLKGEKIENIVYKLLLVVGLSKLI